MLYGAMMQEDLIHQIQWIGLRMSIDDTFHGKFLNPPPSDYGVALAIIRGEKGIHQVEQVGWRWFHVRYRVVIPQEGRDKDDTNKNVLARLATASSKRIR